MLIKIPLAKDNPIVSLGVYKDGIKEKELQVRLAEGFPDKWGYFLMEETDREVKLRTKEGRMGGRAIQLLGDEVLERMQYERIRPLFHLAPECGTFGYILRLYRRSGIWNFQIQHRMLEDDGEAVIRTVRSRDLFHWKMPAKISGLLERGEHIPVYCQKCGFENWAGRITSVYWFQWDGHVYELAASDHTGGAYSNFLSQVFEKKGGLLVPLKAARYIRLWKREWRDVRLEEDFCENLRFRISPGVWPDIQIKEGEGAGEDIYAAAFELLLKIDIRDSEEIEIAICGCHILWNRNTKKLVCRGAQMRAEPQENLLCLQLWYDQGIMEILAQGHVLVEFFERECPAEASPKEGIAGNIDFKVPVQESEILLVRDRKQSAVIMSAELFGLRSTRYPEEYKGMEAASGKLIYDSPSFQIYDTYIRDQCYGEPPAYVMDRDKVLSWPRVTEEFCWRKTPWGDMCRQIHRGPFHQIPDSLGKFPELYTGIPVLDVAYNIACEVFFLCSSEDYAMPGQEGMWGSGLFQGKGEGFGVWLRDTTHTAIRCGTLLDREGAYRTLRYTASKGFDNGADGLAMPAVGIWDYYCVTGDVSLIYDTWGDLCGRMEEACRHFDPARGLVKACQSTSNDAFEEAEAGGYCLSTEIYYMEAFLCMERMACLLGEENKIFGQYGDIGRRMRERIRKEFWKEEAGYFTSGPKGSDAWAYSMWETSGAEGAVWGRFKIAGPGQKYRMLEQMEQAAMTEFGLDLFPCRKEKNHFCHSSWGVWNAGIAAAACETGNFALVWKLLMQQVRNAIINRTFYEVVDVDTGRAWRWPGQLWHAAGFISTIFYGLLGISYDEKGMYLNPVFCPDTETTGLHQIRLTGLRFGKGVYDIFSTPGGRQILLDGQEVSYIPAELSGRHEVDIKVCPQGTP